MPFSWVRKLSARLKEYDQIPLYGFAPPFDWDRFSSLVSSQFGVSTLVLRAEGQSWRTSDQLKEGLGDDVLTCPLKVAPLDGSAFWMMSQESVGQLTSWMLSGSAKTKPLSSELLAEGFYRFLLLETLDAVAAVEPFQNLGLSLSETSSMPDTDALCLDIAIEFDKRTCWGRLVIDPDLRRSWAAHFAQISSSYEPSQLSNSVELPIGVKIGSVLLHRAEWKSLKQGDFVVLDRGSYDPRKATGAAFLTLGPNPLFQLKIKQNKMELLDYAFIYEEEMNKKQGASEPPVSGSSQSLPEAEGEIVALKETPVYVTVELARLKVTLDKLMKFAPGNLIDLPIHPDQGVHLTVNGQLVGRAELVHLGETLGIRILEMG